MVREGAFREDLYFRLRGATIDVPPLRARPGDIKLLASAFLTEIAARRGAPELTLTRESLRLVAAYSWPGNVRELKAEVERWAVFCDSVVDERDLAPEIREGRNGEGRNGQDRNGDGNPSGAAPALSARAGAGTFAIAAEPLAAVIERAEREAIAVALAACANNLSATARALEIDRNTLKRKMAAYGLGERSP
jgi:two-component system response regulator AtoC